MTTKSLQCVRLMCVAIAGGHDYTVCLDACLSIDNHAALQKPPAFYTCFGQNVRTT